MLTTRTPLTDIKIVIRILPSTTLKHIEEQLINSFSEILNTSGKVKIRLYPYFICDSATKIKKPLIGDNASFLQLMEPSFKEFSSSMHNIITQHKFGVLSKKGKSNVILRSFLKFVESNSSKIERLSKKPIENSEYSQTINNVCDSLEVSYPLSAVIPVFESKIVPVNHISPDLTLTKEFFKVIYININLESLVKNKRMVSSVKKTRPKSMKTIEKEKKKALQNISSEKQS